MNSSMNVHARPDLRRSQLTHLAAGLFMFSIPLVLIALPLVLLGLHEGKAGRLIEREGHDAEATIERMWTTRKRRNGVGSTGSPVEYHLRSLPDAGRRRNDVLDDGNPGVLFEGRRPYRVQKSHGPSANVSCSLRDQQSQDQRDRTRRT